MNAFKAPGTVVGTAAGFGIAGAGVGAFLGRMAPGFFTQTLPLWDPAHFDPLELERSGSSSHGCRPS